MLASREQVEALIVGSRTPEAAAIFTLAVSLEPSARSRVPNPSRDAGESGDRCGARVQTRPAPRGSAPPRVPLPRPSPLRRLAADRSGSEHLQVARVAGHAARRHA